MDVNAFTAVDYELLMPEVRANTRNCPDPIRMLQLQASVNEFFRRSRAWRQRNTAILTTVALQSLYPVVITTSGVEFVQLHSTWYQGSEIPLPQPGEDDNAAPGATVGSADTPNWDDDDDWFSRTGPTWNMQSPTGWKIYVDNLETLSIAPLPAVAGQAVTGTVSFAPTNDATTLPSFLFAEWRNELAAGAVAMLSEQAGKPWADPMVAKYSRDCFEKGILKAATKHGPIKRNPLRVRPSRV